MMFDITLAAFWRREMIRAMRKIIIGYLVPYTIGIILGMAVTTAVLAQSEPRGLKLTWPANPAEQGVEWYSVEWYADGLDQWVSVGDTSQTELTVIFSEFLGRQPTDGQDLCFRLFAAKTGERGPDSDQACYTYTVVDDAVVPNVITAPIDISIELVF